MLTRRQFLMVSGAVGVGTLLSPYLKYLRSFNAAIPGGTLDPGDVDKYMLPLVIPPAMPMTTRGVGPSGVDRYKIAVRQFQQQILPTGMPVTTVWSYGSSDHPGTFNYPAFTIEAKWNRKVSVEWVNDLKDPGTGNFLPHLLPVDQTLHWANPPGGKHGRDMRPTFRSTPGPYTGPVPIVTHVHGAHTYEQFDGYPEAWFLPAANNIPAGFAKTGTYYDKFVKEYNLKWDPGTAVFQYPNNQRATTLWYHDHVLGMTRVNVYAGPAGFYLLRGGSDDLPAGVLPGPAPDVGADPFGTYYEIPMAIQDRSFNADGSLFFPNSREFFDGFAGPYIGKGVSDISPIWNPEFFGNTMVVNGRTWPFLNVEQRRYRFRLLNGCNSRFLILDFNNVTGVEVWQIGTEGGFLPAPINITSDHGNRLLLALAERADLIVDFTNVPLGNYILANVGPDEPFGGGEPDDDFDAADPNTTGQVMQFRVVSSPNPDPSTPPNQLVLPPFTPLGQEDNTRQISLNELDSATLEGIGPREAELGTLNQDGSGNPLPWMAPITENPILGATEVWEIYNFTEDAHPIHVHVVQFEVVNRQPFGGAAYPPEAWETGTKDTVIAYPDEITRIKARFDIAGQFVWHCHIIDHEDNEMMRPYRIGQAGG